MLRYIFYRLVWRLLNHIFSDREARRALGIALLALIVFSIFVVLLLVAIVAEEPLIFVGLGIVILIGIIIFIAWLRKDKQLINQIVIYEEEE